MQFREGDVVMSNVGEWTVVADEPRPDGQPANGELTLAASISSRIWRHPETLTLLRRPLRVGDMLARIGGESPIAPFEFTVEDGLTPGFAEHAIRLGYTHADGTPIGKWSAATLPARSIQGDANRVEIKVVEGSGGWRAFEDAISRLGTESVAPVFPAGAKALDIHHPDANRAPARIVGHTASGDLMLRGGPSPTEDEKALYWAGVRDREAAAVASGAKTIDPSVPRMYPVGYMGVEETKAALDAAKALGRAENPMIRRPWRGTLSEWVQLIGDHKPAHVSALDMVVRIAKELGAETEKWGTSPALVDVVAKIAADALTGRPSVDRIARALFESDDEVVEHVRRVSEFRVKGCTTKEQQAAILRRDATMQKCWERGHAGESPEWRWYVRAADRADALHAKLGGGK